MSDDTAGARAECQSCASLRELLDERDRRYTEQFAHVADNIAAADSRLQIQIDAASEATERALASAERAVAKAETANEKRFESVNEFRGTLADAQRVLMPRLEAAALLKSLGDKVDLLTASRNETKGRDNGISALWAALVGAAGVVIAVLALILTATDRMKNAPVVYEAPQSQQQTK